MGLVEELKGEADVVGVDAVNDGEVSQVRRAFAVAGADCCRSDALKAGRDTIERNRDDR